MTVTIDVELPADLNRLRLPAAVALAMNRPLAVAMRQEEAGRGLRPPA